jgi:chromosomal replication initiator protein
VVETPGRVYNPLVIQGGPGSGKTRLLHAIGNLARELYPSLDVRCLDAGLLLVDDIQLLPDTEFGQAEFLRVFTTLHSGGRQLVISCDRAPRALARLDDSLRDRLEWGLVAEITGTSDTAWTARL